MRIIFRAGLVPVLLVVSAAPPLGAQPPETTGTELTEAEFLSALSEDHPAIALAERSVASARAEAMGSRLLANPILGVAREEPSSQAQQTDLTLRWRPLERRRKAGVDAAEARVESAQSGVTERRLEARLEMRRIYADWAVATARVEGFRAEVAQLGALVRREELRLERGETSGIAAGRLRLAQAQMAKRLALMEARTGTARAEALVWWPELPAATRPRLPDPQAPEVARQLVAAMQSDHPRLLRAQLEARAAELEARSEQHVLDVPELLAGWQRQELAQGTLDGPIFGIHWTLPLLDRNQAERARARAEADAARLRADLVAREIGAGLQAAVSGYAGLHSALDAAQAVAAGNERLVAGAEASFRFGETDVTDFLTTLASTYEAEIAVLDLYEATLAQHRRLERLAGRALEPRSTGGHPEEPDVITPP